MENTMNRQRAELVIKGRKQCRKTGLNPSPAGVLSALLDKTFPDVGMECPLFPVIVVLFSAALLGTVNVEALCAYTGYGPTYVAAIAENMSINRFWVGDRYDVSEWIRHGYLDEEMFFGRHIQMAIGDM
jgi:hypothetical protein